MCMPFGFMNNMGPEGGMMGMDGGDNCNDGADEFMTPKPMDSDCNELAEGDSLNVTEFVVANKICTDSTSSSTYRYILSNGVTDHSIDEKEGPSPMCEIPWFVKIPMTPTYSSTISECQVKISGLISWTCMNSSR